MRKDRRYPRPGRGRDSALVEKLLAEAFNATEAYSAERRKVLELMAKHDRIRARLDRADSGALDRLSRLDREYQSSIRRIAGECYNIADRHDWQFDFTDALTLLANAGTTPPARGIHFVDDHRIPRLPVGRSDCRRVFLSFKTG